MGDKKYTWRERLRRQPEIDSLRARVTELHLESSRARAMSDDLANDAADMRASYGAIEEDLTRHETRVDELTKVVLLTKGNLSVVRKEKKELAVDYKRAVGYFVRARDKMASYLIDMDLLVSEDGDLLRVSKNLASILNYSISEREELEKSQIGAVVEGGLSSLQRYIHSEEDEQKGERWNLFKRRGGKIEARPLVVESISVDGSQVKGSDYQYPTLYAIEFNIDPLMRRALRSAKSLLSRKSTDGALPENDALPENGAMGFSF